MKTEIRTTKFRISAIKTLSGQGIPGKPYSESAYNYEADKSYLRTLIAHDLFCALVCHEIKTIRKNRNTPEYNIVMKILEGDCSNVSQAARNFSRVLWDKDTTSNFCNLTPKERDDLYNGFTNSMGENWEEKYFAPLENKSGETDAIKNVIKIPVEYNLWPGKKPDGIYLSEDEKEVCINIPVTGNGRKKTVKSISERLKQIKDPDVINLCNSGKKGELISRPSDLMPTKWDTVIIPTAFSVHNLPAELEQKKKLKNANKFLKNVSAFSTNADWLIIIDFEEKHYKLYKQKSVAKFLKVRNKLLNGDISLSDLEGELENDFYNLIKSYPGIWNKEEKIKGKEYCLLDLRCMYNEAKLVKGKAFTYPCPFLHPHPPSFSDGGGSGQLKYKLHNSKPFSIELHLIGEDGKFGSYSFLMGHNPRYIKTKDGLKMKFCGPKKANLFDIKTKTNQQKYKISFRPEIYASHRNYIFKHLPPDIKAKLSNIDKLISELKSDALSLINQITDEAWKIVRDARVKKKWDGFYLAAATTVSDEYKADNVNNAKQNKNEKTRFGIDLNMGDDDYWAHVDSEGTVKETGSTKIENGLDKTDEVNKRKLEELNKIKIQIKDGKTVLKLLQQAHILNTTTDSDKIKKCSTQCRRLTTAINNHSLREEVDKLCGDIPGLDAVACRLYNDFKKTKQHIVVDNKFRHLYSGGLSLDALRLLDDKIAFVSAFHKRTQPNGHRKRSIKTNGFYQMLVRKRNNIRMDMAKKSAAALSKAMLDVGADIAVFEDLSGLGNESTNPAWSNRNNTNWRKRKIKEQLENNLNLHKLECYEVNPVYTSVIHHESGLPIVRVNAIENGYIIDNVGKIALSIDDNGELLEENSQINAAINIARRPKERKGILFTCYVRQVAGDENMFVVDDKSNILIRKRIVHRNNDHTYIITSKKAKNLELIGPNIKLYRKQTVSKVRFNVDTWHDLEREKRVVQWQVAEMLGNRGQSLKKVLRKP